jgi:hypothetical protein
MSVYSQSLAEQTLYETEEIETAIKDFSKGYEKVEEVKSHTVPISKKIECFTLISSFAVNDKEDEAGYILSQSLEELIKSVGKEYEVIIRHNFNLENFKRSILLKRSI